MKKISIEEWNEETSQLLQDYANEKNIEVDELSETLVTSVLHKRSEMWINYKQLINELI